MQMSSGKQRRYADVIGRSGRPYSRSEGQALQDEYSKSGVRMGVG
jgi:hypothetical protein